MFLLTDTALPLSARYFAAELHNGSIKDIVNEDDASEPRSFKHTAMREGNFGLGNGVQAHSANLHQ